jgi:hypothetical protein
MSAPSRYFNQRFVSKSIIGSVCVFCHEIGFNDIYTKSLNSLTSSDDKAPSREKRSSGRGGIGGRKH